MFLVYWIIGKDNKKTYIGQTDDLPKRLKQHKNGEVNFTKNFKFKKVYILENDIRTRTEALKRERNTGNHQSVEKNLKFILIN